jgi:pimeloyl-ACP methyl ester carboxylesterase
MNNQANQLNEGRLSRRAFVSAALAGSASLALAQDALPPYGNGTIRSGIRSRRIANVNGITVHILEAGYEAPNRPAVLLLHGFPELAYSWRKVMPALASAGYHVIAPDQRGYGRTTGWDNSYDADPNPFRILNMTRDAIGLIYALGHRSVAMVVGHDAGAPVASWSALIRPDIFRSITIMSSPFEGAPSLPFDTANSDRAHAAPQPSPAVNDDELDAELARLDPPRKYYQNYQRTRGANDDMLHAPQGLHAFFRAYYFYKSADYKGNKPHPLKSRTAAEMAQIPTYYVMEKNKGMAATVAPFMPPADYIANCKWLTEAEVDVYATEYGRTGFTGALQGYRVRRGSDPASIAEMHTFSGRTIDVPSQFIAGKSDWGVYQTPGAVDKMRNSACTQMAGFHLLDGAGHWVQQEQPERVSELLVQFARDSASRRAKL